MRSPAEMGTIQIDITNACTLQCSNCTRFCGNHRKPFFMGYDDFQRAVVSLEGFNGVTGVMGGEPTLHPEFERFVLCLRQRFGRRRRENRLLYPQRDFIREIRRRECESCMTREREDGSRYVKSHGPGLWSNMGASYWRHYEIIQDTFEVQYLNDHLNPSYHQPGLFSRRDLGIPDGEWIPMRDRCWVQNEWSATITPKGAFFCEIAGALDMLFGGPGGWKVEPGWWRRMPEDFGDQLHWCEICGFALTTFVRNAEEEVDDVSPTLYEKLKEIGSPRYARGKVNLVKVEGGRIAEESKAAVKQFTSYDRYMEHYEDRFSKSSSVLYHCDYTEATIPNGEGFGAKLNALMEEAPEWILLKRDAHTDASMVKEMAGKVIWNPGALYLGEGYVFFSKRALSVRRMGYAAVAHMRNLKELMEGWQPDKIAALSDTAEKTRLKRPSVEPGRRYAIWGAGLYGEYMADAVEGSGGKLVLVADRSPDKQGTTFAGLRVQSPEYLAEHPGEYDRLILAHFTRFEEMEREAVGLGIEKSRIRLPYQL